MKINILQYYASRRVVITSAVCLLLIVTFYRYYEPLEPVITVGIEPEPEPESEPVSPCLIWPDWDNSSQAHLVHDTVITKQPTQIGDSAVLGDADRCLLVGSRLDQYRSSGDRDWDKVRWGAVQRRCAASKYELSDEVRGIWHQLPDDWHVDMTVRDQGRTAVVLRAWDTFEYTESRRAWLRALIAETALHSNGDYQVFLLVDIKDNSIRLDNDEAAYGKALQTFVPEEFRDMALLFNQWVLESWYPLVVEHSAKHQMYQALQIFAHKFSGFTHVWQLEMDMRVTSHIHSTLEHATRFATAQPRRNLWERNGQFYIPEHHGNSYESFIADVDAEIGDAGIWGPAHTADFEPKGPEPPPRSQLDWGVGEDADLISLFPMIDPTDTLWIYEHIIHGLADGSATPRRAAFVSITRVSRRLLQLISEAQRERGQWVVSEATPESFALLHGLKAVTLPHPISFVGDISASKVDEIVNRGPPHSKAGGKEPVIASTTTLDYAPGPWPNANYFFAPDKAPDYWRRYMSGECIEPMLLHPVKEI